MQPELGIVADYQLEINEPQQTAHPLAMASRYTYGVLLMKSRMSCLSTRLE